MTFEQIKTRAQRDADRTLKTLCVLNLNRYAPLYVVRDYDARLASDPSFVCVVRPDPMIGCPANL